MHKLGTHRRNGHKAGLPPGSLVFTQGENAPPVEIRITTYNNDHFTKLDASQLQECLSEKDPNVVTWIDVAGLHDPNVLQAISQKLNIHPLVQEDILNVGQRPKSEDHGDYIYTVIKSLQWNKTAGQLNVEQISLILSNNIVISFRERPEDLFATIRERLETKKGRIRTMGADYLAYCILDVIVDGYFSILETLGDKLEPLEDEALRNPTLKIRERAYRLRQEGLLLRKHTWPVRECVASLERMESPILTPAISPYLRDLYDHAIQIVDTVETFREVLHGVLDLYLASLSNRMNEVMKVLTIIATIFIPLTFIAGVYGMNFKHMPELQWPWGYAGALGLMAIVAGGMLLFFRKKKWL